MKILLVEEDPAMTDLLATLLQPRNAVLLKTKSDTEVLNLLPGVQPDLVIIDRRLRDTGRWQICRSIRKNCTAPILILSAINDPIEAASALDAGADHYLVKPVTSNVLMANIKTLFRRSQVEQNLFI